MKILIPTTGLKTYTKQRGGYLGIHITNFARIQIPTLDVILEVANELGIEVIPIAKEHIYNSNDFNFRRYFTERGIKLKRKCPVLFDLILETDAIVFPYVSTIIIEGLIVGKKCILLDLFDLNDRAEPLKEKGLKIVYTKHQLARELWTS